MDAEPDAGLATDQRGLIRIGHVHLGQTDLPPQAVRKLAVDIVVMGTIGRSGLAGVVMGNTAEKVFSAVECSVVAVKPEGFQTDIPLED